MTTVYIHIGAPKTATSTLQAVLASQHKSLLKQGVLYPRKLRHGDAHHLLVCDLIYKHKNIKMPDFWYGNKPRGEAWKSLRDEVESYGDKIHSVVVSSELFFGQTRDVGAMLEDIRDQLAGYDVKIVSYLRRQDQLYSSFYNQDVKGARQWGGPALEFYNTHQIFQKDYYELLEMWAAVFGRENIVVRPFEVKQLKNEDIVEDFCDLMGVEGFISGDLFENDALGVNQLYLKRCLNVVGCKQEENDKVLAVLQQLIPEKPAKNILYINRPTYQKYRQQWLQVNNKLEQTYLAGEVLFDQSIALPAELELFSVNREVVRSFMVEVVSAIKRNNLRGYNQLFARAALRAAIEQRLLNGLPVKDRVLLVSQ